MNAKPTEMAPKGFEWYPRPGGMGAQAFMDCPDCERRQPSSNAPHWCLRRVAGVRVDEALPVDDAQVEAAAKAVRHELEEVEAVNDYTYSETRIVEICESVARAALGAVR